MSGKRDNQGKLRLSLVPPAATEYLAQVMMFGAAKYGDYNWRKAGKALSLLNICDSLERHLMKLKKGQDLDDESGLSHIGHILANAAFLAQLTEDGTLVDDRYCSEKSGSYSGEVVVNGKDVVTFQGKNVGELNKSFKDSMDDYREFAGYDFADETLETLSENYKTIVREQMNKSLNGE